MKRITCATTLAVALLASAPLFAAGSGISSATGTHAATPELRTATVQGDCSLPSVSWTALSATPTGLLTKPDSTSDDPTEVDRRLNHATSCVRPLGLWNEEADDRALTNAGLFRDGLR